MQLWAAAHNTSTDHSLKLPAQCVQLSMYLAVVSGVRGACATHTESGVVAGVVGAGERVGGLQEVYVYT